MKKILSLVLALVMIIGMLPVGAINASAAEVSETIALAGSTGTLSGESISWTSDSLTFTANKNTSSTAIRTSDTDHFRLYVGFSATINCTAGNITKIVMTATGSSYAIAPTGSDGSVGTVSGTTITIVPKESSATYTIPSITKQTRIKTITVTYATVDSGECAHTNTETIEAVAATCTTAGNTAGVKCADCGAILEGNETIAALGHTNDEGVVTAATCTTDGYTLFTCTVCGSTKKDNYVDATGHTYVDGVCSVCGLEQPTGLDGKYYIAAIRSSGNYMYMSNDLGTASTTRYQQVDSGLTELPTSIENAVDAQVFELIYDAATSTYKIKTGDQYLGWTSGNSGTLVDEATAIEATIDSVDDGAYNVHFAASDAERYLALNSNAANAYFAWYKQGQAENLYLIPVAVSEEPEVTEPTDPSEPEVSEPESSEPEVSEPESSEPEASEPVTSSEKYYIAAIRSSGNYFYMTSDLGTASTKRYTAADSNLTALPESITEPEAGYVFAVVDNGDGTYSICAEGVEDNNYLGWTSGNSGALVAEGSALKLTKDTNNDGTVTFHFAASDAERYLALNGTAGNNYFAWYKAGQKQNLTLIPVGESVETPTEPEVSEPEVSEPDTTEFEGEVDTTDPTEPELPYVTAPEAGVAYHLVVAQNNASVNKTLYATGAMSGNYFATSEAIAEAASVYLETVDGVEGGFRLYYMNGDTKTYLVLYQSPSSATSGWLKQVTEVPTEYYTFNTTFNTLQHAGADNTFYMGCYNAYTTISGSNISYISESNVDVSQFPARLYPVPTEEVVATAADGANKLETQLPIVYNGTVLPATVTVGDVEMNVAWSIETADSNAVQIVDGKLVLAPQAAAASYVLTATVQNGADDTATAVWNGTVVAASSQFEDGLYVIWTDGKAATTLASGYGFLQVTDGITVTNDVVSGHVAENLFTLTANGDGTYSIVDNNGNYLYSDMSYASSKQFNVGAAPAAGHKWTVVADGNGNYYIYNVDRAAAIGYDTQYNSFGLYTDATAHTALTLTATTSCVHSNQTTTTVPAGCDEDGSTTVSCADCGMVISETVLPATGHDFQDGICANCGKEDPSTIGDRYYIATIRTEGNFFYMTEDLGTASTLRYQAADSGLTVLPSCVQTPSTGYVFVLLENEDGTYKIYAENAGLYLGWTSGNSGALVSEADALNVNLTQLEDGTYNISFVVSETETRYLALNSDAKYNYYAWYKSVQKQDLTLIPVCEHDDPILDAAVAPTYTETGLTEGSHCGTCGAIYTAQQVVPVLENPVTGWNITLGDSIGVNFEMTLAENDTVKAYLNGEEIASTLADGKLTVVLAAAQMTDEITIKVNDMVTSVDAYTVRKYADVILADETKADCHALVKEMLNYGAASQTFFGHTGTLANEGITVEAAAVPTEGGDVSVSGSVDGITFYGASLLHKDKIAVRFYFQADSIEGLNFTVNGETCEAVSKDDKFYVEVAGINPQDLNDDIMVIVNEELSVSYSPMDYIIRMYNKAESSAELKALVQALYGYYAAAEAYTA